MPIRWKDAEQYVNVILFVFQFSPVFFLLILENVLILDLALSVVKGLMKTFSPREGNLWSLSSE